VTIGLGNAIVLLILAGQAPLALGLPPGVALGAVQVVPAALPVAALALGCMLWPVPGLPAPLVALVAAALLHHALAGAGAAVGPVVGQAPSLELLATGIAQADAASPALPDAGRLVLLLLPSALSLALLATLEALAAGAALREASGQRAEPRRDLRASAIGMLAGGALGGMPASSLTTPSMACWRWGGRGRTALVLRAAVALLVLVLGGSAVAQLPYAALAGVLPGAVLPLFKLRPMLPGAGAGLTRRVADALVVVTVIGAAAAFGLVAAVGLGVLLSVVIFTASMATSPVRCSTVNPVGRSRIRRPAAEEARLREAGDRIELVELEGPIFFGSAEGIVLHAEQARARGAEILILDLGCVTRIDLSGGRRLLEACRTAPGRILVAPLHPGSRAFAELQALGLLGALPAGVAMPDLPAAIEAAEELLLASRREARCTGTPTAAEALAALGLPTAAVPAILPLLEDRAFPAGSVILRQGEVADAAFLLLEGQVPISLPARAEHPATRLAVLAPGVIFGESALLGAGHRTADATARSDVRCLRLSKYAAETLRRTAPDAAWQLMAAVARQLTAHVVAANATIDRLEA
jgi:MFS superfamily sulfate permease-like transporter